MAHDILFTTKNIGPYSLRNRITMPPLTRSRSSQPGNVPNDLMATYYSQRAGAGLMITEGIQIEPRGQGYAWTPGIHSPEQVEGWKKITQAVHAKGGVIFAQLWHVGSISHTSLQPNGDAPVAPSAIANSRVQVFIETGPGEGKSVDPSTPRELSTMEVKELVKLYARAAHNAMDAGFDGVELHCANGYLVNQFMSALTNTRSDEYGGSLRNRLLFLQEVTQAVANEVGADRVGVRFSPLFATTHEERAYLGIVEEDPHETYVEAVKILEAVGVAYVSLAEADWNDAPELPSTFRDAVRKEFRGVILYAGRYTADRATQAVEAGWADLVAFGRPFIANPDLPDRIANGWPLNPVDTSTMYGGTEKGYIDYPFYDH